jgi:hypothetical protein
MAKNIASVHRFGDKVAVYLAGMGETVYLTVLQSRELAEGLAGCADSIKNESFRDSSFGILEVEAEES